MKAIIDIAPPDTIFDEAMETARRFDAGLPTSPADYRLHFDSARLLFSYLTGTRMELLDTLRRKGACTVYALAKACKRHYSNVHRDVAALEEMGLIERNEDGAVLVPFDSVEIRLGLSAAA